jgi:hypothetical protein
MWYRAGLVLGIILVGGALSVAHGQSPPQLWFSGDGHYLGGSLVDVARDGGNCFVASTGEMSCARPPQPRACAPNCSAPSWHPPMQAAITLCTYGGNCQQYTEGRATGAPWPWWEQ